jgi:class 3 adenylate cyclase
MRRKPEGIVSAANEIKRLREELEAHKTRLGILFVDMVGSSQLKHPLSQAEWLPVVAWFFTVVADIVRAEGGEIVKYIGDEVMAIFSDRDAKVQSVQMEGCIWNIEKRLQQSEPQLVAKYAMDFGAAAHIHFAGFPQDYLGTVVDRCARISKFAKQGTAVASLAYVRESKNPRSWRLIGKVPLKGFPDKEAVYQLDALGDPISSEELLFASRSQKELMTEVQQLTARLKRCMSELQVQREK